MSARALPVVGITLAWAVSGTALQARTPHETALLMAEKIMAPDRRVLTNRGPVAMSAVSTGDDTAPPDDTVQSTDDQGAEAPKPADSPSDANSGAGTGAGIPDAAAINLAPPALLASMVGATAVDTGFPEFVDSLMDVAGRQLDAGMAGELLASIGRTYMGSAAHLAALTHRAGIAESDPFHARAPAALPGDAPDATWHGLTNHNFGSPRWVAVAVSNKLSGFSGVATNVQLQHTTGPIDVEVKVSGWQGLNMAQSMSVSYDSIALVDLSQNVKVGMIARGSLGTLGAFTPSQDQVAGPIARLKLFGNGTSLSAETGYTFRIRQENDPALNRFHANLNLNVKM